MIVVVGELYSWLIKPFKYQVYAFSNCERQKDDIEYAISSYVEVMNKELYTKLAAGKEGFLLTHSRFKEDMKEAIEKLSLQ